MKNPYSFSSFKIAIVIPAYNEEASIVELIDELKGTTDDMDAFIVNDGSTDGTADLARSRSMRVLDLPCNLGVGGAVQVGFRYAFNNGYDYVVRIDADGQHPPSEIYRLMDAIRKENVDLVIGSRYIEECSYENSTMRSIGIKILSLFLSIICRARITDPTSGFWVINRKLMYFFAHQYPSEYPEPEAIAMLRRYGFCYMEVPVRFRARRHGESKIHGWGTIYYMIKVCLALVIDRIRPINQRFEKNRLRASVGNR